MAHKTLNGTVHVFDITTFLWHARCFAVLIRPFVGLARAVVAIVRWRYQKLTFLIWLLVNLFTTIIPSEYTVLLFGTGLAISCALGLLHHYTQLFVKLFPDRELEMCALQTYLQQSWGDEQKILEEYRSVLLQIDNLLASFNSSLEFIYYILRWEQVLLSACCFAGVLVSVILIGFADLRIFIFLMNNAVLLGGGVHLHNKTRNKAETLIDIRDEDETVSMAESQVVESEKCDNEESDIDEVEGEEQDSSESTDAKPTEEAGAGKSRPNVVKKLMDLRKRHHQANAGVCSGCQASFMSILKRKYLCCNCGNQFCSRCCSLKVPKSFLGVTAPSTKNDTVLLCTTCHRHLMAKSSS